MRGEVYLPAVYDGGQMGRTRICEYLRRSRHIHILPGGCYAHDAAVKLYIFGAADTSGLHQLLRNDASSGCGQLTGQYAGGVTLTHIGVYAAYEIYSSGERFEEFYVHDVYLIYVCKD